MAEDGIIYEVDEISKQPVKKAAVFCLTDEGKIELVSIECPLPVKRIPHKSDTAYISNAIAVTGNSSVKIADANIDRKFFSVCTDGDNQAVWIKLQPASDDNDKKGIWIEAKIGAINYWEMLTDNIYTGEISAISNGGNVNVYVTEYGD